MKDLQALVERALAAKARQAEVFHKRSRGRELSRVGSFAPEAPRGSSMTAFEEEGLALRVRDEAGRYGLAWSTGPLDDPDSLVAAALFAARAAASATAPIALAPGPAPEAAALRLADPEALALPEARLHERLNEAEALVAAEGEGALDLDRQRLCEVLTETTIVNSEGLHVSFRRTLATLSVALAPVADGARAVIEEGMAVRLADLDARDAVRDAIVRGLPRREPMAQPGEARIPVVLEPRAAATLVAALAPLALHGAFDAAPGVAGTKSALDLMDDPTVPGAPGSAPFDGCGEASRALVLIEAGRTRTHAPEEYAGRVVRASYRDRPLVGLRALHVAPLRRTVDEPEASIVLSIAALDVAPGGRRLGIRRGEWRCGAEVLGPADGLVWEGKLEALVRAIGATGDDPASFHPGLPVTTPSLWLYGLGPWRSENP